MSIGPHGAPPTRRTLSLFQSRFTKKLEPNSNNVSSVAFGGLASERVGSKRKRKNFKVLFQNSNGRPSVLNLNSFRLPKTAIKKGIQLVEHIFSLSQLLTKENIAIMKVQNNNQNITLNFNIRLKLQTKLKEEIMEQNLQNQNNQPFQKQPTEINQMKRVKIALLVFVGIFILTGTFYGGIKFSETKRVQRGEENILPSNPEPTTPKQSITQIPTTINGWISYQNKILGYSINYPSDWFELGEDPGGSKNFSNKNVGAPLEMGSDGFWVTIRVKTNDAELTQIFNCNLSQPCIAKKGLAQDGGEINEGITKIADLNINGHPAVKYLEWQSPLGSTSFNDHFSDNLVFAVKKDNTYYVISSLSLNKDTANKYSEMLEQMAKSFQILASAWKEYKNQNHGFSIRYPQDWIVREHNTNSIGFGTTESIPGGMIWGVNIYDITGNPDQQTEDLIKQIGNQFGSDRKEKRENLNIDGRSTIKVTVTTNQYKDWVSETIFFVVYGCNNKCNKIFSIGNGAIKDKQFEEFYSSFYTL